MNTTLPTETQECQSLERLAAEIDREAALAEEAWTTGLAHAIRAGELLREAKRLVPHGQWSLWLRHNFCHPDRIDGMPTSGPGTRQRSERTAQVYMQLARQRHLLDPQTSADLSVNAALKGLAAKQEPRSNRPHASKRHARTLAKLLNELALASDFIEPESVWVIRFFSDNAPPPEALRRMADWLTQAADHFASDPDEPVDMALISPAAERIQAYQRGRWERSHIPHILPETVYDEIEALSA